MFELFSFQEILHQGSLLKKISHPISGQEYKNKLAINVDESCSEGVNVDGFRE